MSADAARKSASATIDRSAYLKMVCGKKDDRVLRILVGSICLG